MRARRSARISCFAVGGPPQSTLWNRKSFHTVAARTALRAGRGSCPFGRNLVMVPIRFCADGDLRTPLARADPSPLIGPQARKVEDAQDVFAAITNVVPHPERMSRQDLVKRHTLSPSFRMSRRSAS